MEVDLLRLFEDDPHGPVQETGEMKKQEVNGETGLYPVYRIKASLLRYNPQNDRIATWMSLYRQEHGGAEPEQGDLEAFNKLIEAFITHDPKDYEAIRKTQKDMEQRGQLRPGIVLANGLVIDGNRRFTCVRRLERMKGGDGWFEAIILPSAIGEDRKAIKRLELAIQHGEEERVGYDPVNRLVGIYNDVLNPQTGVLTAEEYAESANMDPKDVKAQMVQARLMVEFLDFAGMPLQFHKAKEYKVAGPLGELPAMLKKCKGDKEMERRLKQAVFSNIIVEPEGDITRFVRPLKRVVAGSGVQRFLDGQDRFVEKTKQTIREAGDASEGVKRLRGDETLKQDMRQALDAAKASTTAENMRLAPLSALKKVHGYLDKLQGSSLSHLSKGERQSIESYLQQIHQQLDAFEDTFYGQQG